MYISQLPAPELKTAKVIVRELGEGAPVDIVLNFRPTKVVAINYTTQTKSEWDMSENHEEISVEVQPHPDTSGELVDNFNLRLETCEGLNEASGEEISPEDPNLFFYIF